MKTLSTEALDASSARFLEFADSRLSGYVRPLTDSLEQMDGSSRASSGYARRRTARSRAQRSSDLSERAPAA